MEWVQWVGCAFGLLGSAMLAMNSRYSGWGFVAFLFSNLAWIYFGLMTHATGLIVMQIGFTATSLIGVWKWLLAGQVKLSLAHKIVVD